MTDIIHHPSVVLVIGRRRSGKSVLAYGIGEKFHTDHVSVYVVSLPKEKHHLLPDWLHPVDDIENVPENSLAIVDEGSLKYHAHKWQKKETEVMDRIISVSGQKKQTIIFVLHHTTKFAINLLREIDTFLIKQPALLQSRLERSTLRKIIEEAEKEFKKLPKNEIKKNTYVISDNFTGFIRNKLPSFWSEELSEAWAGIKLNKETPDDVPLTVNSKPHTIDSGLKLWFLPIDKERVLHILSRNSTIDGELSSLGVQCSAGKCYYSFDLRMKDMKYHVSNNKFDLEKSIKEFETKNIKIFVDITSSFPLNLDDVDLRPYIKEKQNKKNELEEYADKVEL